METITPKHRHAYSTRRVFLLAILVCTIVQASVAQEKVQPGRTKAPGNAGSVDNSVLLARRFHSQQLTSNGLRPTKLKALDQRPKTPNENYFVFTGQGNWFTASNWKDNQIPPAILKPGDHIIIDGSGPCVFNNAKLFSLTSGSILEVKKGKKLFVGMGNNFILTGGSFSNQGDLIVLSGVLSTRFTETSTATTGRIKTTRLSRIDERKTSIKEMKTN
jgi:hypothetical protein